MRGQKKRAGLVFDLVCAALLGGALCAVLLPALGQDVSAGLCLLLTAADLLFIHLVTRRWWILPLLLGGGGLLTLLVLTLLGESRAAAGYVAGFFRWSAAAFPYTEPYSVNGSLLLVRLGLSLPGALVCYVFYRRLFFLAPVPLVSGALAGWLLYAGSGDAVPVLFLLLAANLLSLPKSAARRISRELPENERVPAASLQLPALGVTLFVLLFTLAIAPKTDGQWRSEGFVRFVEDIDALMDYSSGSGPGGGGGFSLASSGFAPLGDTLGGDVETNNGAVLDVQTETPLLLKGAVYDAYDGASWSDAGAPDQFRLDSALWRWKRREVFVSGNPAGGRAAAALYGQLTRTVALEIDPAGSLRTLFYGGQPLDLRISRPEGAAEVWFNSQSELYLLEKSSQTYTVTCAVFDRSLENFGENMTRLEALVSDGGDKYYEDIAAAYLRLYDGLPESVFALAEALTEGLAGPYEKARAIEAWLNQNCAYTLSPGAVPEGEDFVGYFLKTRTGYCTYFASAMTVLARCAGLPARYVTGYGLKRDPGGRQDAYVALNATAHAWTEVYLYGVGWVVFDPSGFDFYEPAPTDAPAEETPPSEAPAAGGSAGVSETPAPEATPGPETPEEPAAKTGRGWGYALTALLAGAGALCAVVLTRLGKYRTGPERLYLRLRRKFSSNGARAGACWASLLRQLHFFGLDIEAGETLSGFALRADARLGAGWTQRAAGPVTGLRYAGKIPPDREIAAMCALFADTERRLRRELGFWAYLWRRIVVGR